MARGAPDYGSPTYYAATVGIDLTELALGIMGFLPIDNLGRWFFFDNFREGLAGWDVAAIGDGVAPRVLFGNSYIPPNLVQFQSGTVGGDGGSYMGKYIFMLGTGKFGLELALRTSQAYGYFQCFMRHYNGVERKTLELTVDWDGVVISIVTPGGAKVIASLGVLTTLLPWLPIKIVGDMSTGYFERALIGGVLYDISDEQMVTTALVWTPGLIVEMVSPGTIDENCKTNLGYVLVTTDEL